MQSGKADRCKESERGTLTLKLLRDEPIGENQTIECIRDCASPHPWRQICLRERTKPDYQVTQREEAYQARSPRHPEQLCAYAGRQQHSGANDDAAPSDVPSNNPVIHVPLL